MASSPSHVAMVAFPFGSHAASLFSLACSMSSLSPSTHFSFLSTKPSLASLTSPSNVSLVSISDGATSSSPAALPHHEAVELFLESAKESLREGLKEAELAQGGRKVSCIVSDAFFWMTADVADEMAVKWVPVLAGAPLDLYAWLHADLIRETVGGGSQAVKSCGENLLSFLPGLSNHRVSDLPGGPAGIITDDPNLVFFKICDQMAHKVCDSDVVVLNAIEGFDFALDSYFGLEFPNYFAVGPFSLLNSSQSEHPADSYGCLSWLDRHGQATVAYVSLGTIADFYLPPSELASLAKGLVASGVPFLWSLKEEAQSILPPEFIDRMNETGKGKIVPWTPQSTVLQHSAVGAFVSHCGWNSVLESILGGVPMVCRPFLGDHMVNTRSVSHVWKFGVALDEGCFTEKSVVNALDAIFKKEEGKKMRNKVKELKAMATEAIGEHGTSMENLRRLVKFVNGS